MLEQEVNKTENDLLSPEELKPIADALKKKMYKDMQKEKDEDNLRPEDYTLLIK